MSNYDPINLALDYIENNLCEPISPNHIAFHIGYSRTYFDHCFSAVIGESPASYLRRRRLSEAARQLITTEKTILEIALEFQYKSAEAFTRAFYQEFRLTPSAYRKRKRLVGFFSRMRVNQEVCLFYVIRCKTLQTSDSYQIQQLLPMQNRLKIWTPPKYNQILFPANSLLFLK